MSALALVTVAVMAMGMAVALGSPQRQEARLGAGQGSAPVATTLREVGCAAAAERYGLTRREQDMLELLARGDGMRQAADSMAISLGTAQTYSKRVYRKMGVHSRQEALDLVDALSGEGEREG